MWVEQAINLATADVKLSPAVMAKLESLISQQTVVGPRFSPQSQIEVDTEIF
jgi:hypothetical protein